MILPTILYTFQHKVYTESYNFSNGGYIISAEITYLFSDSGIWETFATARRKKHLYDKITEKMMLRKKHVKEIYTKLTLTTPQVRSEKKEGKEENAFILLRDLVLF